PGFFARQILGAKSPGRRGDCMMARIVRLRPARQAPTATQARRPEQPEAIAPRGRMRPPPWLPRTAHVHFRRLARLLAAEQRESPSHVDVRSEEHTSELQSRENLVCRLLLEKKNHSNIKVRKEHLL